MKVIKNEMDEMDLFKDQTTDGKLNMIFTSILEIKKDINSIAEWVPFRPQKEN